MPFEQVSGSPVNECVVLVKDVQQNGFQVLGGATNVYPNKAAAIQAAEEYMGAPSNGYQAVVMEADPTAQFIDAVSGD